MVEAGDSLAESITYGIGCLGIVAVEALSYSGGRTGEVGVLTFKKDGVTEDSSSPL